MKLKISLMVCTAFLFIAFPVLAQTNGHQNDGNSAGHRQDRPHGFGNGSDHSGHDNDGNSAGHRQDAPHGFGDRNLVLANPAATAAVANAASSVTDALSSGSLKTSAGAVIPVSAQAHTYSVLTADAEHSASSAVISAALSTAGPEANTIVPSLVNSFSRLASNPASLPSAIYQYNRFTKVASNAFILNPPPEFIALNTVLARLSVAAVSAQSR